MNTVSVVKQCKNKSVITKIRGFFLRKMIYIHNTHGVFVWKPSKPRVNERDATHSRQFQCIVSFFSVFAARNAKNITKTCTHRDAHTDTNGHRRLSQLLQLCVVIVIARQRLFSQSQQKKQNKKWQNTIKHSLRTAGEINIPGEKRKEEKEEEEEVRNSPDNTVFIC